MSGSQGRYVGEVAWPELEPPKEPDPPAFTLRFEELPHLTTVGPSRSGGMDRMIGVRIHVEFGDRAVDERWNLVTNKGPIWFYLDEWDRIWRSLVDATGAFDKRGISLVRTHPPDRI